MTPFDDWAVRHNIPFAALMELHAMFCPPELLGPVDPDGRMEDYAQSLIRREAPRRGWALFRNNVGALKDLRGIPVRFGLANDSKEMNKVIKSADLIGLRPVLILPEHVGSTIGQFVSIEAKHPGWKPGEDPVREKAQTAWAGLIRSKGGLAVFSTGGLPCD